VKNLKVFWVVVVAFAVAAILLMLTPILGFGQTAMLWLGVAFVFGSYSGCSGLPSVFTTKQMPKGEAYTASYPKMLIIVLMSWILFIIAMGAVLVAWMLKGGKLNYSEIQSFLFQGFLFASAIGGIFAGVKKLNSAAKESGPDPVAGG